MPNQLRLFLKCVVTLTAIALAERVLFIAYDASLGHSILGHSFSLGNLAYTLLWGIRFDAAVAAIFSLLAYLFSYLALRLFDANFHSVIRRSMYVAVAATILLQGADIMYYAEAGRHLGYEMLDFFNDAFSLLGTAVTVYHWIFLLHIALTIAALWLIHKLFREKPKAMFATNRGIRWVQLPELSLLLILLLSVILIRGGFQSVPQSPLTAQAIGDTRKATLALNGAYNALYFVISGSHVDPVKLAISDKDTPRAVIKSLYPAEEQAVSDKASMPETNNNHKPYNVVVILLESWPAAFMQSYGFSQDVTPNFDALRKRSLTTYAMLAGGHRTTEGMFSVFCSAQNPLGRTVAQSQLENFDYHCLPRVLREQGYYTAFFQGTNKNTSGTGVFAQMLGFTDSYGRKSVVTRQYPENSWGVHDPDLYKLVLDKMHRAQQPFLMGINTATTHDITLPPGIKAPFDAATSEGPMLNVMHFADTALADFIATAQRDPTLGPTVFVIVADHTSTVTTSNYQLYSVPFAINAPGIVTPKFIDRVATQRDIAPTLFEVLGKSVPAQFTGKSLLRDDQAPYFADYYHSGVLGWIEGNQLLEIPVLNPKAYHCYDYRNDPVQARAISCQSNAPQLLEHALAFTATSQQLLFSGHLDEFGALKSGHLIKTGMVSASKN